MQTDNKTLVILSCLASNIINVRYVSDKSYCLIFILWDLLMLQLLCLIVFHSVEFVYIVSKCFHMQQRADSLHCSKSTGPFILQPLFQKNVEKWFQKSGSSNSDFFFWSTTFLEPEKIWIYGIKPPFFLVNHFSRTRFLEPDFSNQISRTTFLHFSRKEVAE